MIKAYIYGLIDPRTGEIRYIGKSIRPKERLTNHCNEKGKCHRTNWLNQLKALGLRPELRILEELPSTDGWQEVEIRWIAYGKSIGWKLTNNTSGGDGVCDLPEETRERIRQNWIGRKHKRETRDKIGIKSRGRKHSEESKEHMRRIMTGRKFTDEWKKKISNSIRKISDVQVSQIKFLLSIGWLQYKIAEEFGVHKGLISHIKRGVMYPNIQAATYYKRPDKFIASNSPSNTKYFIPMIY